MRVSSDASHCGTNRASAIVLARMLSVNAFVALSYLENSRTVTPSVIVSAYSVERGAPLAKRRPEWTARTRCGSLRTHVAVDGVWGSRVSRRATSICLSTAFTGLSSAKKGSMSLRLSSVLTARNWVFLAFIDASVSLNLVATLVVPLNTPCRRFSAKFDATAWLIHHTGPSTRRSNQV